MKSKIESEKSIAKNSVYYLIYNVLNVIFPLVTGIYVARILLPSYIGEVAYAQNISTYCVILAFLGIPTYGMREVAKYRKNIDSVKKIHSELLVINFISTSIVLLFYLIFIFTIPSFKNNYVLYLITGISIVLNYLNNSWLFQGLEEFKYICVRNIIFKVLLFVLLVVFVRKKDDYIIYALISSVGSVGAYFLNIIYASKRIGFCFKHLELRKHLKPIFFLVVVNLAIEIYTLVDVTMLGFFCEKEHVAFYTYGSKIYKVLLQIINTFTVVIVPKMSLYYANGQTKDFNNLLSKTLKILIILSVPSIIGIYFVSDFLVIKLYGEAYVTSITVIKILSFNLLISPVGYLLGSRVMLATNNEKKMILPVVIGCVINVIGNLILIPIYKEIGAALASVFSELVVASVYVWFSKKHYKLNSMFKPVLKVFSSCLLMICFLIMIQFTISNSWIKFLIQFMGAVSIYIICLFVMKEENTLRLFRKIVDKIKISKK